MKEINKLKDFLNKKYCMITLAACIAFSTLIAFGEFIIKLFGIDLYNVKIFKGVNLEDVLKNARLLSIYFAANALVGLLIELRSRLKAVQKETPKSFTNLIEATESIKEVIKKDAYKNRREELIIRVYGRRHRQNIAIIKQALDDIRGNNLPHRKIVIYLYYSNPEFLDSLKLFNENLSFVKMIDEQKEKTENSMRDLRNTIDHKRYDFVELKLRKHFDTPPFWAIQIDNNDLFWGYFMRSEGNSTEYIQGTPHKCFHFDGGTSELDGFSDWINNIFERLDKWAKEVN